MFYPVDSLRRGGRFYLCWVADSWPLRFATITHRQLWSQDIRQICDDLLEVVKNESGRPSNRFSLRLSSQLMRGLVRLYQRKVSVVVGDLCMINARVMKSTHKKFSTEPSEHRTVERHVELPRLVFEEQVDEERVEDRIQNSGNLVAHVEDITLREPTLPENRPLLDDGFGEMHPDQTLQLLGERSVEMMLLHEASIHHSGLDLPLDKSTDKSGDKSRDRSRLARDVQMERIEELDVSVYKKSIGDLEHVPGDFEKEIPEIPDIPPPEPPAPQPDNQAQEILVGRKEKDSSEETLLIEKPQELSPIELVLEELEEPQAKRRKVKPKLIIDKKIKLSSDFIRSRIDNNNLELRCEDAIDDVISVAPTASILFLRPAHCGYSLHTNVGFTLAHMFSRNLGVVPKMSATDKEIEEAIASRSRRSQMRSLLQTIDEEVEPAAEKTLPIQERAHIEDISKEINVTVPELIVQDMEVCQVAVRPEQVDISDLPTQKLLTESQAQDRVEYEPASKIARRSGYVSFRQSQQTALDILDLEANKENIPGIENITVIENVPAIEVQPEAERLTSLLQDAGLADIQDKPTYIEPTTATQKSRKATSEGSETPLGSLDRTKVSLGDSEKTTDSKRFIREEWGTEGTMLKIYKCIKQGSAPVDVHSLIRKGPVIEGHRRIIAARCFASILKLKQHGFVCVSKDPGTNEIKDIKLGIKITGQ